MSGAGEWGDGFGCDDDYRATIRFGRRRRRRNTEDDQDDLCVRLLKLVDDRDLHLDLLVAVRLEVLRARLEAAEEGAAVRVGGVLKRKSKG